MKITTSVLAPDEDNHISGVTVNTQVQLILGWWTVWVKAKTIKLVWFMVFNATFNYHLYED
jgi:hypothetical protein